MTIASEITRLQWAKADIKTAIVNKWVSVADSVSLSNYCDCINAISSWWKAVEVLVVWWGWAWTYTFWWWWWGWVVKTLFQISWWSATVTVGAWWTNCGASWWYSQVLSWDNKVCATWWWGWAYVNGGTSWSIYINSTCVWWGNAWWTWVCDSRWTDWYWWWWGWWAGWAGCAWTTWNWSDWWVWLYWYWWWWWGWSDRCGGTGVGAGVDWWGTWENRCLKRFCCNANNYWWWWGGAERYRACWCQWVVDICYSIYWMSWFTSATWWNCCYVCDGMCVHRFTSNWTFTIVS